MPEYKFKHEGSLYRDLDEWLEENRARIYAEYGIDLHEDKDQWIIDFAVEAYELGIVHENEFLHKEFGFVV